VLLHSGGPAVLVLIMPNRAGRVHLGRALRPGRPV